MKLIKLLAIIPAVLMSDLAAAQQTYVQQSGSIGLIYTKRAESEPATGSQYFIDAFSPAKIGNSNEISIVRYNAYSDELEVKVNEEIRVLQPTEGQIIALTNNEAAYQYVSYINKDNVRTQNHLVLINNSPNLKIYKREKVYLQPEQHPTGGYQKYKAPMYKKEDHDYYIKINDGDIVYMPTKKKDFLKMFPGKDEDIEKYMKKHKLSVSDEKELEQLGDYINTIL